MDRALDDVPKTPWSLTGSDGAPKVDQAFVDAGLSWLAPLYEAGAKLFHWSAREMDDMEPWEIAAAFEHDRDETEPNREGLQVGAVSAMFGGAPIMIREADDSER